MSHVANLEIVIGEHWLSAYTPWGDLEWSTIWPGGSDAASWQALRVPTWARPGQIVRIMHGGEPLFCGTLDDPSSGTGGPMSASGLHRLAQTTPMIGASGNVSTLPGDVNQAVLRGLPWRAPAPFALDPPSGTAAALDPTQVYTVAQVLDAAAQERGEHWGVDPRYRTPYMAPWPTVPTLHLTPGFNGLVLDRDGYASTIIARYLDSTTSTFTTVTASDANALHRWGWAEKVIREPLGEGEPMDAAKAQALVDGLMAQGVTAIGWGSALSVEYGDVVTPGGAPVDLARVNAPALVRVHGITEDVAPLSGATYVDVHIAGVSHSGSSATLTPRRLVSPMLDALSGN